MNLALYTLVGVATIYAGPYVGEPLFCDNGSGLIYAEDTVPWIALDSRLFESGWWACGDLIYVTANGNMLMLRALDAGAFWRYRVGNRRIVADIPAHLSPFPEGHISGEARIFNVSAFRRQFEQSFTVKDPSDQRTDAYGPKPQQSHPPKSGARFGVSINSQCQLCGGFMSGNERGLVVQ